MEDTELEPIFNGITFMNSIGLFYCLLMLKENLDVPTYSNIIKELKKLCSKAGGARGPDGGGHKLFR